MDIYEQIRSLYLIDGLGKRAIARKLGGSRNTVAKYCQRNRYPRTRAEYFRKARVLTPEVVRFVDSRLAEDAREPNRKLHHTARRIYGRLRDERGSKGVESTICALVRKVHGRTQKLYLPLHFNSGDMMQIDWGDCTCYL